MRHQGGCHCGNIRLTFETTRAPGEMELRACLCSFCRKHATRATADPEGHLTIEVTDPALLNRYSFGYRTAAYLLCRTCGVYVAAVTLDETAPRALVIVNALESHRDFTREALAVSYDGEDKAARMKRRREGWTPVTFRYGASPAPEHPA